MNATNLDRRMVHVRAAGRSLDVPLAGLRLTSLFDDETIRLAVAHALDLPGTALKGCVVDRHANGNLTIRPEAVFG